MSGIEVVSLVLGAIPLFISAAEHYRDGLGFVKRVVRKRAFIKQYLDELTEQQTLLLLYLKAVVGKTDLLPNVQATLVNDPGGAAWQTPTVVRALTKELGDAYQPFVILLTTICTTLAKQIRTVNGTPGSAATSDDELLQRLQALCLESTDAQTVDKDEQSSIWKSIKFSWRHPERLIMLQELKAHNNSLEKLASAANRAKPYERKQQSRKVHATFELRNDTERLYQALCKACTCSSSHQRTIGFGLGLAVRHIHKAETNTDLSFEIVMFDAQNNACTVSVKMAKPSDADSQPPPKKRVRIGFSQPEKKSNDVLEQRKKLGNICKEHHLVQQTNGRLHLVVDEKDNLYKTDKKVANPQHQSLTAADPMLSICDIMTKFKLYDRKRWLHREKAILAVILAYSLLQIHHSSWWQSVWTSESISFLGLEQSSLTAFQSSDHRVKLRRPFTRSVIAEQQAAQPQCCLSKQPNRNAHLHALGIVLLELFLNRSIKEEVDTNGYGTDYRGAAQDLLDEHADDIDMTAEYLRAVKFCLSPHPNPYSGSFSFEDKGFREIFYTEVISMLEDDLNSRFEVNDDIWTQDYE